MNHKLLIISISGLATIGGLFLFSDKPEQQMANIVESLTTPSPSPRFDLGSRTIASSELGDRSSKRSNLEKTFLTPSVTVTSNLATPLLSSSPASVATSPSTTPLIPTPQQTSTPMSSGDSPQTLPSPSASPSPVSTPATTAKININTANQTELEKITGVGPTIAQRIIDYRNKNGPFQAIEDIKKVNGIGDKNFEKMKSEITI